MGNNTLKIVVLLLAIGLIHCSDQQSTTNAQQFHNRVCALPSHHESPWHIRNLYSCQTQSLYIPYQLFTGAFWHGDRNAACMHSANRIFNRKGAPYRHLTGPIEWLNPENNQTLIVWQFQYLTKDRVRYLTCHENGIGRRYDSNKSDYIYFAGRCQYPAGAGWQIGKRRYCTKTTIEITRIDLDDNNELSAVHYDWWIKDQLDSSFALKRYKVNTQ